MKLQIEYVPVKELKPYANNAKVHTADQIDQIKASIERFGFNDPIAVWKDNEIIEGHGRLLSAIELGLDEVPVIRLDELTDEERKAYTIVHNKLTLNTTFDLDLLGEEITALMDDFDMTEYGFGDFELTMLTADIGPEPYNKDIEEEYAGHEKEFLKAERVIINYTEETEAKVKELLRLPEITKVVYDIEELWGQE